MSRRTDEGHNRILDAEDAALWAHVAAQVRPLVRKNDTTPKRAAPAAAEESVLQRARTSPKAAPLPPPAPAPLSPASRERLHRGAERKLRRGAVAIGGRLDLHGLTRVEAHGAVNRFLARLADEGERVALVITGKGGGKGGRGETGSGVLRSEFPRWLSDGPLARLVLAWRPAAARHGGDGAFYVLLRRKERR